MLAAGVKADESGAFVTVLPLVKIRRMTYAMHCWVLFDAALGWCRVRILCLPVYRLYN